MNHNYEGRYLREMRKAKGITQEKLSTAMDVHMQFVSNWERGLCSPPRHSYKKLIKYLKIDTSELIGHIVADRIDDVCEFLAGL